MSNHAIVADIGGTSARFSRVNLESWTVDKIAVYPCMNFPTLVAALTYYRDNHELCEVRHAAIAIACPVTDDCVRMTNFHWQFSITELQQQLEFTHLQVINDFTAAAMSLSLLASHETIQIGHGKADLTKPKVILGAGTGLGVAHLIPSVDEFIPLAGEGGHATWAAQTEQEWFIQRYFARQFGHVSWERLLSGPGLENLYRAMADYKNKQVSALLAAEIASKALTESNSLAYDTVMQFFASLGSYAGDLALSLGAFGGVYIAGGMVPKLLALVKQSEFRARFEAKGRFNDFNSRIPTYIVVAEQPGLLGAAAYLKQKMRESHGI